MLRAIIFDVDGTLAETEDTHRAAFNRAFGEAGLAWHWDEALYGELLQVAGGKERIAHYASDIGEPLDTVAIADLHARKTGHYVRAADAGAIRLRPGVATLIAEARDAGVRLAIASTTTRANVDSLLSRTLGRDWASVFEVIVAGDVVPTKKPAPDAYLAVLAAMRLSADDCVAIEDSPDGLAAARAAGIATLVTPSRYMAGCAFVGATRIVDSLTALADASDRLLPAVARLLSAHDDSRVEMPGRITEPGQDHRQPDTGRDRAER